MNNFLQIGKNYEVLKMNMVVAEKDPDDPHYDEEEIPQGSIFLVVDCKEEIDTIYPNFTEKRLYYTIIVNDQKLILNIHSTSFANKNPKQFFKEII
jgi:hypothetical protein